MLVGEGQGRMEKTGYGRTYSVSFSLLFLKKNDLLKREMVYCLMIVFFLLVIIKHVQMRKGMLMNNHVLSKWRGYVVLKDFADFQPEGCVCVCVCPSIPPLRRLPGPNYL